MTRRRIIFWNPSGIGIWVTPEINGDRSEMEHIHSADSCELEWSEIKALFMGVQNRQDFINASNTAQRCFHSSIAGDLQPVQYMLSLDALSCDKLYEVYHGEIRRIYGTNPVRIQVYYREQDSSIVDTAEFDCPPGRTQAEVIATIHAVMSAQPIKEDEDRLSYMEDILTCAALKFHATWTYLPIADCIEVD